VQSLAVSIVDVLASEVLAGKSFVKFLNDLYRAAGTMKKSLPKGAYNYQIH
jgi:hypothetical protein